MDQEDRESRETTCWPNETACPSRRPDRHEYGAGLAEYALLLLLVALACIGALTALAPPLSNIYNQVAGLL